METDRQRVAWVDAAKGLCILLVVMMHSTLGVEKAVGDTGWLGSFVAFAQPFRMPDFFLISGLFLARVIDRDWRTYLDRRVVHFLYFYVLWLTIQFAFKAPGMIAAMSAGEVARLYLMALTIEPFGTLWFLWILPIFAVVVRLARPLPLWVLLVVGAALEIAPIHTGWTGVDEFAARFVYFVAGYALAPRIFDFAAAARRLPAVALAGLAIWAVGNGAAVAAGWSQLPGVSLFLGAAGAIAVVTISSLVAALPRVGALLCEIGARSIVVYLAFFLPMALSRSLLIKSGVIDDVGLMSLIVTTVAVVVPFFMAAAATRCGAHFLFERPAWAHLKAMRAPRQDRVAVAPAE